MLPSGNWMRNTASGGCGRHGYFGPDLPILTCGRWNASPQTEDERYQIKKQYKELVALRYFGKGCWIAFEMEALTFKIAKNSPAPQQGATIKARFHNCSRELRFPSLRNGLAPLVRQNRLGSLHTN